MKITRDLAIDAVALLIYVVAANPLVTGLPVHEWVSVGAFVVFLVHVAFHWDWAVETARRISGKLSVASRWNLIFDVVLLLAFMVTTVSGVMVSRHVLFAFGYFAPGYFVWRPMHAISATVLLAVMLVHLAMHWKWISVALRSWR